MIRTCPRCDYRFDPGGREAGACPGCGLPFGAGADALDARAPEGYVAAQAAAIAARPLDAAAVRAVACHVHPEADAAATCAGCGRPICEWCNVVEEGTPQCETCYFNDVLAAQKEGPSKPSELAARGFDPRQPIQWELRSSLGRRDALQRTWRDIMLDPRRFFHMMPLAGDSWSPLIFALSWGTLGLLLSRIWRIGGMLLDYRRSVERGFDPFLSAGLSGEPFWDSLGWEVVLLLLVPAIALILFLAEVALLQTMLLLVGERHARIRITWRLVGYAAAPWALLLVPGIGLALALVTHLGVLAVALRQGYHLRASRAWLVSGAPIALGGMLWYAPTLQAWAQAGYRYLFGG